MSLNKITTLLGSQAEYFLNHQCKTIAKEKLHTPGSDFISRTFSQSNRSEKVLANLSKIYNHGRLSGTGYVSILPVDQGIEHSAGASFAPNPDYFDPENIVRLAIEGGCNAVASTFGVIGAVSKKYAKEIPFIVKINVNAPVQKSKLSQPFDQNIKIKVCHRHHSFVWPKCDFSSPLGGFT